MQEHPDPHHHLRLFTDHRWAVAGAVIMYTLAVAVFVVVAVDSLRAELQVIDDRWLDAMVAIEWRPLTLVAEVLDRVGSGIVMWPVRIAVCGWLAAQRLWTKLTTFAIAVVASDIPIGLLKEIYERDRPTGGLIEPSGFSFPSGHAIAGAATALAIVVVAFPPGADRRIWEVRAVLFAFAMALSRTYLGAHWLSDVVAGSLFGAATVIAVAAAAHRWRLRRGIAASPGDRLLQ